MTTNRPDREKRKRAALHRLGCDNPRCSICGIDNWTCLEAHHIAGRAFDAETAILCRNCHRHQSDCQRDHPTQLTIEPAFEERLAHFLQGMADLFEVLVSKLREFAAALINKVQIAEESQP